MAIVPFTSLLTGSSSPLLAAGDVMAFVDVSDTTQAATGSTVKATQTQFFAAIIVPIVITSASANAIAVGRLGATTPAFVVDASTASQVAGLKVTGAATGGTVAVVVIDSGSNANLTVNAKGSGTIGIGSVSTGAVTITPATTITGALTQTGLATFNAGATVASGQTLTVSGATITGLTAASVGAGTFPSGAFVFAGALSGITTLAMAGALSGVTTIAVSSTATMQKATFSGQYGPVAAYTLTDGATIALDWVNGNVQKVVLAGSRTFTFANPVSGARYIIVLEQGGAGSYTITWPTIKWLGGVAPVLTTTVGKKDVITLVFDGTDYLGGAALNA